MIGVGSTVGNYQVLQKVGEGAMGSVFAAHHPRIGKKVALKVIHPDLSANEEMLARFFNEARAVTQIGHENIVEVQDYGQTPDGESFIVMELLEGRGLGDAIKAEGAFAVSRAVHIALQIADGLSAAHALGIIHRDLKPDNVMLIRRGSDPDFVKVLDFGLAKLTGPGAGMMQHQTRTGSLLGTAHYMAPEQAESSKGIDQRVDVYALGCILFQLLTGRVPFPGEGFGDVLIKHIREPPPLPSRLNPQVPKGIEKIVLHALAKKPEFRFANMEAFRTALRDPERFQAGMEDAGLRHTPSEPMPAPRLPNPFDDSPPTIQAPMMAPKQLPTTAATVQGQAPAEVQKAIAARAAAARQSESTQPPQMRGTRDQRGKRATVAEPHVKRRKSSLPGVAVGLVLGLVVLGGGGFVVWRQFLSSEVTLTVAVSPADVEVVQGGQLLGTAPGAIKLTRSAEPVELTFRKQGFLSALRKVTPDSNQDVRLRLLPRPEEPAEEPDAPPPPKPVVAPKPPVIAPKPPVVAPKPLPAPPKAPVAVKPPPKAPTEAPKPPPKRPHAPPKKKEPNNPLILTPSF